MTFQKADENYFDIVREFYWSVIDDIHNRNINNENLGWEKGVYPSDEFIRDSISNGELFVLTENEVLYACVILNSEHNDGYNGCHWSIDCNPDEVITPHALAVNPIFQRRGIGRIVVGNILDHAIAEHKKAVRLDVLAACKAAEDLYKFCGFRYVETKNMYYDDTGWTEYKLYELNLLE